MENESELYRYYEQELSPALAVCEQVRVSVAGRLVYSGLAVIAVTAVLAYGIFLSDYEVMFVLPVVLALRFWLYLRKIIIRKYRILFKKQVIAKLVQYIDSSLEYFPNESITQEVYDASLLYNVKHSSYEGEDLVKGLLGKTRIAFSKLITQQKEGNDKPTKVFCGLFFLADFNKEFSGFTVLYPNYMSWLFRLIGKKTNIVIPPGSQKVKLEDAGFMDLFSVYASDQIEARYILTPSLMDRLKEHFGRTKKAIRVSFIHSSVFVAIPMAEDLFEPRVYRTLLDFSSIRQYYDDLNLAIGIVEELNLNCRVWTKQ